MTNQVSADAARPTNTRWRSVALPAEHGSWGLAVEPIVLGLLVAPTWPGLAIGLAAFATFLLHRPMRTAWTDYRRGRRYPRTALAIRFVALYGFVVAVGLLAAFAAVGAAPLVPLALALPLFAAFSWYLAKNHSRSWQAELAAPAGFAAVSSSIALADGWSWSAALALWVAMVCRSGPSVMYIRARLRLEKGERARVSLAIGMHVFAIIAAAALVDAGLLPPVALVAFGVLLLRAALGLSTHRRQMRTQTIGIIETVLGAGTVLVIAVGYWLA